MAPVRVVVGNQKGGSGKTTTTANLAATLVEAGYRTLAVDLDPQAQLAVMLQAQMTYDETGAINSPNITHVLMPASDGHALPLAQAVLRTPYDGLDVVAGSFAMRETAVRMQANAAQALFSVRRLFDAEAMRADGLDYDYVVMDTAPSLDPVLDAALVGADFTLPVLAPEVLQVEALLRYVGWVERIRREGNPTLRVLPALVNKAVLRWVSSSSAVAELAEAGVSVFDQVIPTYAQVAKTADQGPIVFAAANTDAAGVVRAAMLQVIDQIQPAEVG